MEGMNPVAVELFHNEVKNCNKPPNRRRYSEEVKDFAFKQMYHSTAGYEQLRKTFTLPTTRALRSELKDVECNPGILLNVFRQKKEDLDSGKHGRDAMLIIDEMKLRKGIEWDPQQKTYVGYPSIYANENADNEELATDCLGVYLKGLEGHWETICAYYLTTHLPGQRQAEVVKDVLKACHEHGVRIHGLVFDGTASNLRMAEALGADLTPGKFKPFFPHPVTGEKINIFLDTPHMLKLARNHLADAGKFRIPGFTAPAEWSHISALHDYQQEIGFRALGNKLTKKHIMFQRHKMKVSLAVQCLSSSVADALSLVKDLPQFVGCESTIEFCRRFDAGFDLLNSRSHVAKGDKSPITRANFSEKKEKLLNFHDWLRQLKLMSGQKVENSQKGTFVIGLCINVLSTIELAEKLLFREQKPFTFFLAHNTQQDFLEHFFGRVRRKGGLNDNPTAVQVKFIIRQLLVISSGGISPSLRGNCTILTEDQEKDHRPESASQEDVHNDEDDDNEVLVEIYEGDQSTEALLMADDEFKNGCLAYLAGYVTWKIHDRVKCLPCQKALFNSQEDELHPKAMEVLQKKSKWITIPSNSVFRVVRAADQVFERMVLAQPKLPVTPKLIPSLVRQVARNIDVGRLFPSLDDHVLEQNPANEEMHSMTLFKLIAERYLHVRCLSYTKLFNQNLLSETSQRNSLLKKVQFLNI